MESNFLPPYLERNDLGFEELKKKEEEPYAFPALGTNFVTLSPRTQWLFYFDYGKPGCFEDEGIKKEQYADYLLSLSSRRIVELILNHEHRKLANQEQSKPVCHFQAYVKYASCLKLNPANHLGWAGGHSGHLYRAWVDRTVIRDPNKARQYCLKKDTRVVNEEPFVYESEEWKNMKASTNKNKEFFSLLFNRNFESVEEMQSWAVETNSTQLCTSLVVNSHKFANYVAVPEVIRNGTGWDHSYVPPEIKKWFREEFSKPPGDRRLGLVIYGRRGCGKTRFFSNVLMTNTGSLDNPTSNPSIVYFRNEFNYTEYIAKPNALLTLCDDMTFDAKHLELIKALLSSQPATMNTKYQLGLTNPLPAVYMTNNSDQYFRMKYSPDFSTQATFYRIEDDEFFCPEEIAAELKKREEDHRMNQMLTNRDDNDPLYHEFLQKKQTRKAVEESKKNYWLNRK